MLYSCSLRQMLVNLVNKFSALVQVNDSWTTISCDQLEEEVSYTIRCFVGYGSSLRPFVK